MIAIVVITHNRLHLLRRCVEDVLHRTSEKTKEIIIWDNASADGTREYLDALDEPRLHAVHHPENIGMNAYAQAFSLTSQDYLVELDDDVVEAPPRWDETLLDAFLRIPKMGYLSANLVDDPNDSASQYIKYLREQRSAYTRHEIEGIAILEGPNRRQLHDDVPRALSARRRVWAERESRCTGARMHGTSGTSTASVTARPC